LGGGTITTTAGGNHYAIVNNVGCTVTDNAAGAVKTVSGNIA
jgi:hypothetical protein